MGAIDKKACDAVCTLLNAIARVSTPEQTARVEHALLIRGLGAQPVEPQDHPAGATGFQALIGVERVVFYFQWGWHWAPVKAPWEHRS